jgi:hypothetical protein
MNQGILEGAAMVSIRWILLVFYAFMLAACTPMEWRRGSEVATMNSEAYQKCQQTAHLAGMRFMPSPGMYHFPHVDNSGVVGFASSQPSLLEMDRDRAMHEHTALMQCMMAQGFNLVPIAPQAKGAP